MSCICLVRIVNDYLFNYSYIDHPKGSSEELKAYQLIKHFDGIVVSPLREDLQGWHLMGNIFIAIFQKILQIFWI